MIEIKPMEDTAACLPLLDDLHLDSGSFVLAARDGAELAGAGVLRLLDGYAVIEQIVTAPGFEMLDYAIGKALLNFIERREVLDVVCVREELAPVLRRLGFAKTADGPVVEQHFSGKSVYFLNLEGYFTKHC